MRWPTSERVRTAPDTQYDLYYSVRGINGGREPGSTLYRADPANGSAAAADNQPWGVRGGIYQKTPVTSG